MRGVGIDQHQAVRRFGEDVGIVQLRPCHAQRMIGNGCRLRFNHAGGDRKRFERCLRLGKALQRRLRCQPLPQRSR